MGRDLAPRVSSTLRSGLTADCTSLVIGDHTDAKSGRSYENLLYQIRPAFGGNIIATIVNPDHRPQMATVREGVMRKEELKEPKHPEVKRVDVAKFVKESDLVVKNNRPAYRGAGHRHQERPGYRGRRLRHGVEGEFRHAA